MGFSYDLEENVIDHLDNSSAVQKCVQYNLEKGISALRLSYLYDGTPTKIIPPIEIFTQNTYKKYKIPNMTADKIKKIISFNCFGIHSSFM